MKRLPRFFIVLAGLLPLLAHAERAEHWEVSLQMIGNVDESSSGSNGSRLDIDSDIGIALGGAYHVTEQLELGVTMSFLSPEYKATINVEGDGPQVIKADMDVFNGNFYAAWNFMKGPFTPYVRAGLGWTYLDSNIVSSDVPITACWWDPWWGYICSNFYDTYDDTRFTYGAGLGLRYQFEEGVVLKAGYDHFRMEGDGLAADPDFDLWRLEVGWMFRGY